jgi:hypothetical protein
VSVGYFAVGKRLGDLEHGFARRLIECKCGLRYRPEEFERHLRDSEKDRVLLAVERSMKQATGASE